MRTILILTDFSTGARNGATLGLHLASHLRARLLLMHIYQKPLEFEVKDSTSYPLEDQLRLVHDPSHQLQQEVIRLGQHQKSEASSPVEIESCSYLGSFRDGLNLVTDREVIMAVTGDHHNNDDPFSKTNHVSECEQLLNCPLLVVPAGHKIPIDLRTVAFATDLAKSDLKALKWLQQLTNRMDCKLFTGHVSLPSFNMSAAEENATAVFMKGMEQIDLPLYTFQNYFGTDIPTTLKNFCADKHADLLAVVYKKHSKLRRWLVGSTTEALLSQHEQPLLLIPASPYRYKSPIGATDQKPLEHV